MSIGECHQIPHAHGGPDKCFRALGVAGLSFCCRIVTAGNILPDNYLDGATCRSKFCK